ncbi:hypothetical protein [Paraburkholderia susongensis]|uniref:Uncharacterized protein n=1 Tax=Paraburkholderia susongensis TaxID=1515439 RepID=A0A1X7KD93_9BURK|nr:hypothetical protein [Paraburkholderia susongensis]SMG39134.1 hypothetical protein SAMN06265784_103637 [Paraburkholderia susongensis]
MKKALICIALALLMMLPVTIGIVRIPIVEKWLASSAGYEFFIPLFKALGSIGGESNMDIIFAATLVVGFVVSLVLAAALLAIVSRLRHTHRR